MEHLDTGVSIMKTILVLGATGMLGSMVYNYLKATLKYNVYGTSRHDLHTHLIKYDAMSEFSSLPTEIDDHKVDYIINCIGVIKPLMHKHLAASIAINSVFPYFLETEAKRIDAKLIHITTDCVYSGEKVYEHIDDPNSFYNESDPKDAHDEYGKSKALGEMLKNGMVIRTSIIGPEIDGPNGRSLIAWVQKSAGLPVNGFTNHYWNGITTKQYAKLCEHIIDNDAYKVGLQHVFSPNVMTKYDLVKCINEKYNKNNLATVTPVNAQVSVNRALSSVAPPIMTIPTIEQQIEEL